MAASSSPPGGKDQNVLMMVDEELKHKIELFNGISRTCFDKCVDKKHKDVELYIGETSCINRCVSKYVQLGSSVSCPYQDLLIAKYIISSDRQLLPIDQWCDAVFFRTNGIQVK